MLHWLKQLRVNCESCPELESRITFLEQQLDDYRRRLEETEKLQAYVSEMLLKADPATHAMFKHIGAVRDAAQGMWTAATELHTIISRIKDAQCRTADQIAQTPS